MNFGNKLRPLSLAGLSGIVLCLRIRQEPAQGKHLYRLHGRHLALPTSIRLGRKGLPGENNLAY
jgi:hypothetical protein